MFVYFHFLSRHFEGLYRQKLYKTKVAGQFQIWKDQGLVCFWSLSASLSRRFYKIKVVVDVPYSAWPQGQGIGPQGPGGPMSGYPSMLE